MKMQKQAISNAIICKCNIKQHLNQNCLMLLCMH